MSYDNSFPDMGQIAQVLKTQLADAGIDVNLQPLPNGQYIKALVAGTFDLGLTFYASGTDPYFGLVNWSPTLSGFTSKFSAPVPAVDNGLAEIASATGPAKRAAVNAVCAAIDQDSAQIPLVSKTLTIAWNSDHLHADVLATEVAANPLRDIARYTTG
jgi:ABC-type transport system substrate-binding protein